MTESLQSATPVHPVRAVGMGGRAHRPTGDQYDYFAVDYHYPTASTWRATAGRSTTATKTCRKRSSAKRARSTPRRFWLVAGRHNRSTSRASRQREAKARAQERPSRPISPGGYHPDPYVQEHMRPHRRRIVGSGKKLNEAANVATSTMTAIMGRVAAYTGKEVPWDELLKSDLRLGPKEYNFDVKLFHDQAAGAGKGVTISVRGCSLLARFDLTMVLEQVSPASCPATWDSSVSKMQDHRTRPQPPRRRNDKLEEHLQEIIHWHFSEETGSPFWLERAKTLKLDPQARHQDVRRSAQVRRVRGRMASRRTGAALGAEGNRRQADLRLRDRRHDGHPEDAHRASKTSASTTNSSATRFPKSRSRRARTG